MIGAAQQPQRVLFITGAAQGIGYACVEAFLQEGYGVAVLDKIPEVRELFEGDPRVLAFQADTTDASSVKDALYEAHQYFGRLDVLLPNAAVHTPGALWELSAQEFQSVWDVNVMGVFHVLKYGIPYLFEQEHSAIVLMGSDQCFRARTRSAAYGASKGALAQMTQSLAKDLGPKGVRVNALCPSTVDTALTQGVLRTLYPNQDPKHALQAHAQDYPLGRIADAHEVARWACFLAHPLTTFTTGGLFPVDGGLSC